MSAASYAEMCAVMGDLAVSCGLPRPVYPTYAEHVAAVDADIARYEAARARGDCGTCCERPAMPERDVCAECAPCGCCGSDPCVVPSGGGS